MDADGFDALAPTLGTGSTRRRAIGALAATAFGAALAAVLPIRVAAAACRSNGAVCKRGSQCCSGLCAGKAGKKRCRRAPSQSTCTVEQDVCAGTVAACNDPAGSSCFCTVTAGGKAFCASGPDGVPCFDCANDAGCVGRTGGQAGDVCVRCSQCPGGRACARRCPDPSVT